MKNLIEKIKENSNLTIKNKNYQVKTKTWYSLEEDNEALYIKCELNNNKVLVIIPDDNLVYIGYVVENMNYIKTSETELEYNGKTYHKTGEGHQYIKNIEFGNINEVEGKCEFEDYESDDNIISLGILTDKNNIRADVFAEIITLGDIK